MFGREVSRPPCKIGFLILLGGSLGMEMGKRSDGVSIGERAVEPPREMPCGYFSVRETVESLDERISSPVSMQKRPR